MTPLLGSQGGNPGNIPYPHLDGLFADLVKE
jgi:hypothetical protein